MKIVIVGPQRTTINDIYTHRNSPHSPAVLEGVCKAFVDLRPCIRVHEERFNHPPVLKRCLKDPVLVSGERRHGVSLP